jgi:integrase
MPVYKPKNSPYYHYDFQIKGRRYYGSTSCKSKRDAQEYENRRRKEAALPSLQRPPITIDDACGLYQEKVEELPSWPTMRYMLAALIKGIGKKKLLSEVGQRELQRYFASRRSGRSHATVNREIENARAVWRHAEKSRYDIGEAPDWRSLKFKATRHPPRELSFDEEARLFQHLRADVVDAVSFLLKSGWRRDEVLKLRWSDFMREQKQAVTKIKGGDTVNRALSAELVSIIDRQPRIGPFIFTYECQQSRDKRRKGQRYPLTATALRKPFAAALEAANIISFRLHDLRHTRGTRIVRTTGSLAAAKEALKHRSISTTLRYAHVMDDDLRRALEVSDHRNNTEVTLTKTAEG